jgi:hypothetical protein
MAFSDFKSVYDVSDQYGTDIINDLFIPKNLSFPLSEEFMKDLEYSLGMKKPNPSEIAVSENFISPIMRVVARHHPNLIFWSREYYLKVDENLCGTPDYLFSYTKVPKRMAKGMPLVCVSEAKIDDFTYAWGQTLAEMVACQKKFPEMLIYAWASNGELWQFGKLEGNVLTQHSESYSVARNTEEIAGILNWIFTEAVRNAENYLSKEKLIKE